MAGAGTRMAISPPGSKASPWGHDDIPPPPPPREFDNGVAAVNLKRRVGTPPPPPSGEPPRRKSSSSSSRRKHNAIPRTTFGSAPSTEETADSTHASSDASRSRHLLNIVEERRRAALAIYESNMLAEDAPHENEAPRHDFEERRRAALAVYESSELAVDPHYENEPPVQDYKKRTLQSPPPIHRGPKAMTGTSFAGANTRKPATSSHSPAEQQIKTLPPAKSRLSRPESKSARQMVTMSPAESTRSSRPPSSPSSKSSTSKRTGSVKKSSKRDGEKKGFFKKMLGRGTKSQDNEKNDRKKSKTQNGMGRPQNVKPGQSYKSTPHSAEIVGRKSPLTEVGEDYGVIPRNSPKPPRQREEPEETGNPLSPRTKSSNPGWSSGMHPDPELSVTSSEDSEAQLEIEESFSSPRFQGVEEDSEINEDFSPYESQTVWSRDDISEVTNPTFHKPSTPRPDPMDKVQESAIEGGAEPQGMRLNEPMRHSPKEPAARLAIDPFAEPFYEDEKSEESNSPAERVLSPSQTRQRSRQSILSQVLSPDSSRMSSVPEESEVEDSLCEFEEDNEGILGASKFTGEDEMNLLARRAVDPFADPFYCARPDPLLSPNGYHTEDVPGSIFSSSSESLGSDHIMNSFPNTPESEDSSGLNILDERNSGSVDSGDAQISRLKEEKRTDERVSVSTRDAHDILKHANERKDGNRAIMAAMSLIQRENAMHSQPRSNNLQSHITNDGPFPSSPTGMAHEAQAAPSSTSTSATKSKVGSPQSVSPTNDGTQLPLSPAANARESKAALPSSTPSATKNYPVSPQSTSPSRSPYLARFQGRMSRRKQSNEVAADMLDVTKSSLRPTGSTFSETRTKNGLIGSQSAAANRERQTSRYHASAPLCMDEASVGRGLRMKSSKRLHLIADGRASFAVPRKKVVPPRPKGNSMYEIEESEIRDPIQRAGRRLLSKAAIPIQAEIRRHLAKHTIPDRKWAIVQLQSYFRRWRCEAFLLAHTQSATEIQAAFRGWKTRDNIDDEEFCAIDIQRMVRGYLAAIRFYDKQKRAISVQAAMRGKLVRMELAQLGCFVTLMQTCVRGFLTKCKVARMHDSATAIQASWRAYATSLRFQFDFVDIIIVQSLVRRRAAVKLLRKEKDARVLQRTARRWLVRRDLSATKIQTEWRRYRAQMGMLHDLVHIIVAQSAVRRCLSKYRLQERYAELQVEEQVKSHKALAAIKIQSAWRGFWEYSHFVILYYEIVQLQALWRGHKDRSTFTLNLGCTVIIQATARGFLARLRAHRMKLAKILITGASLSMRESLASKRIQAGWRAVLQSRKENSAAKMILRFFAMVKAEVDREILRHKMKKQGKRDRRKRKKKEKEEFVLERAWLNTVDEVRVDRFGDPRPDTYRRSKSAPRPRPASSRRAPPTPAVHLSREVDAVSDVSMPTMAALEYRAKMQPRRAAYRMNDLDENLSLEEAWIDTEVLQAKEKRRSDEAYLQRHGLQPTSYHRTPYIANYRGGNESRRHDNPIRRRGPSSMGSGESDGNHRMTAGPMRHESPRREQALYRASPVRAPSPQRGYDMRSSSPRQHEVRAPTQRDEMRRPSSRPRGYHESSRREHVSSGNRGSPAYYDEASDSSSRNRGDPRRYREGTPPQQHRSRYYQEGAPLSDYGTAASPAYYSAGEPAPHHYSPSPRSTPEGYGDDSYAPRGPDPRHYRKSRRVGMV